MSELRSHVDSFLNELKVIVDRIDVGEIERMVELLVSLRERGGRLFCIGVGGGAAHASHAVSDFRKLVGIEAYTPTDNVAELTARTNDEGWESVFVRWLQGSHLCDRDVVLVFSVGGGDAQRKVSANLVHALRYARDVGAGICGIVGRDGGYTAKVAEVCVVVPTVNPGTVTPQTEALQAVIWHLLVSHPALRVGTMTW